MFNLFDMMQRSQDGSAVENMARQFGLTPRQAENAVDVLLPAFTLALQRQMQNPQLWPNLLAAMQPPPAPPSNPFEAASRAFTPEGMRQGAEFMTSLFGSQDLTKQVAAQGAAASGLPAPMLQQMLPAMGAMLMSGMLKTFSQQGLAGVMEAMSRTMNTAQAGAAMAGLPGFAPAGFGPGGQAQAMAPYMEMFGRMMGAAPEAPPPPPPPEPDPEPEPEPEPAPDSAPEAGASAPNPFDPAAMMAFFGQMMGSFSPQQPSETDDRPAESKTRPEPETAASPGSASAVKSQAKAVGAKPAASAGPMDQQPGSRSGRTAAPPQAEAPAASASEEGLSAFDTLVQTGREVQEQHLRNLRALFAQMAPDAGKSGGGST